MTENLPEVAQAGRIAEQSYELALAVTVDSPEMYEIAGEELRSIVTRRKQIDDLRFSITRPMDEAKARIMELFKGPSDRLGAAEGLLRNGMTTYQREEAAKAERARREAEAKAAAERAAQERLQREANAARQRAEEEAAAARKAGDVEAAAAAETAAIEAAAAIDIAQDQLDLADVAPPTPIAVVQPKSAGISSRKNWKAEVTDFKALVLAAAKHAEAGDDFLLGFLVANEKALGSSARTMQAALRVPGVRVYAEDILSVRKAG